MSTKEFTTDQWTDKLTMNFGICNPHWDEIAEKVKKCESLATDLRAELEELAELMDTQDCTIKDDSGDYVGIDHNLVQDWADVIGETVESNFFME